MAMKLSDLLNPTSRPNSPAPRPNTLPSANDVASLHQPGQQSENPSTVAASSPVAETVRTAIDATLQDTSEAPPEPEEGKGDGWDGNNLTAAQLDGARSPKPRIKREPSIKHEPTGTPRAQTPATTTEPSLDDATMKAIADAQNEYGTRIRGPKRSMADKVISPELEESKPAASKKRPAPKTLASAIPAGIKKPPPKKRKVESSEDRNTPTSTIRSVTPSSTSGRASKAAKGTRKTSISATPAGSSPAPVSSPAANSDIASDVEEGTDLYCICRRPDNHTWMIGCDGGCEDWFHGKCVHIKQEDEDLIDKYICPGCVEKERGVTTWKPMCRRPGCRKPARLKKGAESKYCSRDCGIAFMKSRVQTANPPNRRSTAKPTADEDDDTEPDLGPLGGAIRAHELKALALTAPTVEVFRHLGSSPLLTPPSTASPEAAPHKVPKQEDGAVPAEPPRLAEIAERKTALRRRRALLKEREQLFVMAKEQAARLAVALKVKEMCGYDGRLSWDDATFAKWREGVEGVAAFAAGTLEPAEVKMEDGAGAGVKAENEDGDGGVGGVDAAVEHRPQPSRNHTHTSDTLAAAAADGGVAVCVKRRCQRHAGWQKLGLQDIRFEEADVRAQMRRVDEEERAIREGLALAGVGQGGGGGASVEVLEEGEGEVRDGVVNGDGLGDLYSEGAAKGGSGGNGTIEPLGGEARVGEEATMVDA